MEVDACVEDILNRQEVSNNQGNLLVCARNMHQPTFKGVHYAYDFHIAVSTESCHAIAQDLHTLEAESADN